MGRRAALTLALALVGAAVVATAVAAHRDLARSTARATCGVERWTVKTLQDRPQLKPVKVTTVGYLVSRPQPSYLPDTRLPFEYRVFRVTAAVPIVKPEDDGDLHLILDDGRRTMIAETPMRSCTNRATTHNRRQMAEARNRVRVCAKAVVTGVAFFDFIHGQTGVAPNGIELHPVLGFRCIAGGSKLPPTPPPSNPPKGKGNCAPSYPTVCIPPPPPDLDCGDIPYRDFKVRWDVSDPDPHRFDGDRDRVGCES